MTDKKGKDKRPQKDEKIRHAADIEQEFDSDVHGIPHLDELALRLGVPSAEDSEPGIVLFGKSGRAYPLVNLMGAMVEFQIQAVVHTANLVARMEGQADDRTDTGTGQPEESVDPTRDA